MNKTIDCPNIEGYEVVSSIGEGGMGRVYKAIWKESNRTVAIKTIHPNLREQIGSECVHRFLREVEVSKGIAHPYIALVIDGGGFGCDEIPFVVLEYLEGKSLAEQITSSLLSDCECRRVLTQIGEALSYIHSRGLVHRDVKPANIFLSAGGTTKLLDFGLTLDMNRTRLTATGMYVGTFLTMAPEAFSQEGCTSASDFYGLGATLYYGATGRYPYSSHQIIQLANDIEVAPPLPPNWLNPAISEEVSAAILKMLTLDPNKRLAGQEKLLAALECREKDTTTRVIKAKVCKKERSSNILSYLFLTLLLFCCLTFVYGFRLPHKSTVTLMDEGLQTDLCLLREDLLSAAEPPSKEDCETIGFIVQRLGNDILINKNKGSENAGLIYLAEHAAKSKSYSKAYELYALLAQHKLSYTAKASVLARTVDIAIAAKKTTQALRLLEELVMTSQDEQYEKAFSEYCRVLSTLGSVLEKDRAIVLFERELKILPPTIDRGLIFYSFGKMLIDGSDERHNKHPENQVREAIGHLEKALKIGSNKVTRQEMSLAFSKALRLAGYFERALMVSREFPLSQLSPEERMALIVNEGYIHRGLNDYDRALATYRQGFKWVNQRDKQRLKARIFETRMERMATGC